MQSSRDGGLVLTDVVQTVLQPAQIPPEKFAGVLSVFGRLPEDAQYNLAVRLVNAVETYRLRKRARKQKIPQAHQRRKQLEDISTSGRRILKLLGVDNAETIASGVGLGSNLHPTTNTEVLIGLYKVGAQRRPEKSAIGARERLATLLMLLSDLVEAAERSAREVSTRPGLGGDRRTGELTPEGELIQAIIKLYIDFRNRFPSSGPKVAFDKRLRAFVRSGLDLAVRCVRLAGPDGKKYEPWYMAAIDCDLPKPTRTTDDAIRGAFRRVLAQSKREFGLI
jgi:hypothetical protein